MKLFLLTVLSFVCYAQGDPKVVCYYDEKGNLRTGQGKFDLAYLEPALQFCSHLIYGYAGIDPQRFVIKPLNNELDIVKHNYQQVADLKRRFPGLRVMLSVGGDKDIGDGGDKSALYNTVLEAVDKRLTFINSAKELIRNYGFHGIDLAWQLPKTKPKKIHSSFKQFFINIKHKVAGESVVDEKAEEHREQFTAFIREFRNALRNDGLLLSLSVLPNVNSSVYFDPRQLAPHLDFVTLQNFDFYTPERNPQEADYANPLYEVYGRKFDENGDHQVRYWLSNSFPANKIIYGINTFGRAWKMTSDSGLTGVPPLTIDGPGAPGQYTEEPGLLSYNEVCTKLPTQLEVKAGYVGKLRKINDPTKKAGTYAYKLAEKGEDGIWVSYQDPDTAETIGSYVRAKGLGGIAIIDLTLDDFRGLCTANKYPILRSARIRLM